MNKLILIGNGFDLAHGLPTSYKDFLNDFWENIHLNYTKDKYKELIHINKNYYRILNYKKQSKSFEDFEDNLVSYQNEYSNELEAYNNSILKLRNSTKIVFKFENIFFGYINKKQSIENWVDIENEYFLELKKIIRLKFGNYSEEKLKKARLEKIKKLNIEFLQIKNLLGAYLQENIIDTYDFNKIKTKDNINHFYNYFKLPSRNNIHFSFNDFPFKEDLEALAESLRLKLNSGEKDLREILFLNFNYTPTLKYYLETIKDEKREIKIHGNVNNMIFGFGDETDDDYQSIENLNNNEYLKNFKSFQYSSNPNYNDFFTFLDGDKFHIYIMGHSCGLSDRVLLNNIFEHENCRGIKIFYHKKEDGSDNYLDIVHNISRHFEDKQSMRRKIVNKEYSVPLPQNVRFKKIEKKE